MRSKAIWQSRVMDPYFLTIMGCLSVLPQCSTYKSSIELEPMVLRATQNPDGTTRVDTLDPEILFSDGTQAYQKKQYQIAAEQFVLYIDTFPTETKTPMAQFNAGLAFEALGQWQIALRYYDAYLSNALREKDKIDALFRRGVCLQNLGQWADAAGVYASLLELRLTVLDRAETLAQYGLSLHHLGRLADAERAYLESLKVRDDNVELNLFDGNYYLAMAQHQVGEIYRSLFEAIRFRLPVERMRRDLEDKSHLFLKAQAAYLRAIRMKNTEWALAAGFKIGVLYEGFYNDMMDSEYPNELDAESLEIYYDELRSKVRPLIERAVEVYEKNLIMSEKIGAQDTEWGKRTRESLNRVRSLIRKTAEDEATDGPAS